MKRSHFRFALTGPIPAVLSLAIIGSLAQTGPPANLDWPFYGNDLGGMRYVDVDQINPSNVANLSPVWILSTNVSNEHTSFESQPIIVNGVLYVTSPYGHVFAVEAATGAIKWTFSPDIPPLSQLAICCGQTNRGAAVGAGKVFVGLLDATLVALDANTGRVVWRIPVERWQDKWTETMAPLFVNGKVIIGASGGEFLKRGHVSVYDAEAGRRLWRFYTVPGPGEFGHDTWESDWTDEIDALARAIDPVAVSRVCALNSSAPIDMSHGTRARSSSPARRSGTTGAPLRIRLAPTSPAAIPSRNGMHVKWQGLVWSLSA